MSNEQTAISMSAQRAKIQSAEAAEERAREVKPPKSVEQTPRRPMREIDNEVSPTKQQPAQAGVQRKGISQMAKIIQIACSQSQDADNGVVSRFYALTR